jgi:hypothetical protein
MRKKKEKEDKGKLKLTKGKRKEGEKKNWYTSKREKTIISFGEGSIVSENTLLGQEGPK